MAVKALAGGARMFSRTWYVIRVNAALAALGINSNALDAAYRQSMQELGLRDGSTPEEVAVFIGFQLPLALQPQTLRVVTSDWIVSGKVRREMIDAWRAADHDGTAAFGLAALADLTERATILSRKRR